MTSQHVPHLAASDAAPTVALGPNSISACLVVRHEEAVVARCLESIHGVVDEIILVHDGECEDQTLAIAERFGCRTFVQPLVGHAEAATVHAYEEARGEWILSIDADEFLSSPLRESLRELTRNDAVNGYEFLWRMWDGKQYITEQGPYKLSLFRRSRTHLLGINHGVEVVDPPIERVELQLEHRPLYDNFKLRTVVTKWRRWARINALEFLMPYADLPKFNWNGPADWPARRGMLNALAPLLIVPYGVAICLLHLWQGRIYYRPVENLRMAVYQGLYGAMVQYYVAKYRYLGLPEKTAAREAPRPMTG